MIFIDRSIPRSVAEALKLVRAGDVLWLEDAFAHDVPDEAWLPVAGERGWIVVTRDKKIRSRPRQRNLVRAYGVGCFIVAQKRPLSRWDYLKLLASTLDEMERIDSRTPRPYMYLLGATGVMRPILL